MSTTFPFGSNPAPTIDVTKTIERARAAWAKGQADEAEMACRQVLAVWPGQTDATYLLGLMAFTYGNLDLAISHVREACRAPRAPAVYFSDFAEMCRQKGLLAEGEEAARRAVALAPGFAPAWNNLGIVLQEELKLDESRLCLERALALEPNNPETLNNLANTLKRLGMAAEADKRWRAALDLKPDYAEVYSNLANLLLDQGEYGRAESMAGRAIELNPRLADAYVNLAGVETARHRHAGALQALDALLALAPTHARALAARALALKDLDRLDEAFDAAKRAAFAAPESPEPHNALGQVFQAMGEFEPALEAYDRAAALPGPAQMDAIANRGSLFMEVGRKAEAAKAMEEAARAFPNSPGILFGQTELKRFKPGDPLIGKMQALIAREGISLSDRATLHFGLGKVFLDIGDSKQAFRHYDEGNRLKRSTYAYDPDANERWMASVAQVFSPELLSKADAGARSDLPIFVVGMPRSGTTLVEQILGSHPLVHPAGELKRLQTLLDGFPQSATSLSAAEFEAMGGAYLAFVKPMAAGRRHVVDKMPSNFLYAGFIRLILPDARVIHCRRDPVDTCLSCYTKLFAGDQPFAYDQTELGRFHRAYQALMEHWRATLPASHFLEVDYEAVVDDLEREARRMLDFLGLPWDEACLRFHETERPVRTASVNQVRQPIYRTSAGRWRKHAAELQPLIEALNLSGE
ncbi:MAG TPA: sulfotransferase [Roseiarcus sp.]|jgi:tetratricopeptide (TPR) repeat protein|nr:sulfotransferase [Roseiarcus sp.]